MCPVLMVLSWRYMSPAVIAAVRGFRFLPLVAHEIVVYPAGYDRSWDAGYCCGPAQRLGVDDLAFFEAMIHAVFNSEPGTSARQMYLAGFSNGGRMAFRTRPVISVVVPKSYS